MENDQEFTKIKDLTWEEVFAIWESGEAFLPRWQEHYKQRGFSTWKEWRQDTISKLMPEKLHWTLYEVNNPLVDVPKFRGGPFRSWIKNYYGNQTAPTFLTIVNNETISGSTIIQEMIKSFPKETNIIGLKTSEGIVVIEGMHRCTALAVAAKNNLPITTKLNLIVADYFDSEIPTMGQQESPAA